MALHSVNLSKYTTLFSITTKGVSSQVLIGSTVTYVLSSPIISNLVSVYSCLANGKSCYVSSNLKLGYLIYACLFSYFHYYITLLHNLGPTQFRQEYNIVVLDATFTFFRLFLLPKHSCCREPHVCKC